MPSLSSPYHPFSTSPPFSLLVSPLTPSFVLSSAAAILGYRLRKACFDTLGRQFTFAHTTLNDHQLVTGGPYSVVRHPSYVGTVLVRSGTIGVLFSSGSWARVVGASSWSTPVPMPWEADSMGGVLVGTARIGLVLYTSYVIVQQVYLLSRAYREDETLRKRFGADWEEYRRRVPWMFIPHVI